MRNSVNHKTASWPKGFRECNTCKELLPLESFHPFKQGARGRYPHCIECRKPKSKEQWQKKSLVKKIYDRAKSRASKKNLDFNLTLDDIVIPEKCPVFGVPLIGEYVSSIDRVNSNKGYVKGNIQILSNRANILKNNATIEELEQLLNFLKKQNL